MRIDGNHLEVWRAELGATLELVASTDVVTQTASGIVAFSVAPGVRFGVDDVSVVAADPETVAYEYNDANELTKMTSGGVDTTFTFDAWGRTATKTRSGQNAIYDFRFSEKLKRLTSSILAAFLGPGD